MIVVDCEQNSPDWYQARMGIVTASEFATVMASGKGGGPSVTRKTYLMKLAGEILTGEPMESYSNDYMERGKRMEEAARQLYEFQTGEDLQRVGFVKRDDCAAGASPDSFVGTDGLLEIKTKSAHLHIDAMMRGSFPAEHRAQCQGQLWVTDRAWIDIAIYWPKLPLVTYRALRDEAYIAEISKAVAIFNTELRDIVERVRRYGGSPQGEVTRMLKESLA